MSFFDFIKDQTTAEFCCDLAAIFDGNSPPEQKVKAAGANIELFLNARSYLISNGRFERDADGMYHVPYPIQVQVRANGIIVYGATHHNSMHCEGPPAEFNVSEGNSLIIEGPAELFKNQPQLRELCQGCAWYLFEKIAKVDPLAAQPSVWCNNGERHKLQQVPDFRSEDKRFICWEPLADAFELLEQEFSLESEERFKLRWVWISNGEHLTTKNPYIYLLSSDATALPAVLNPEGTEGLIHRVLKDRTPQILWNYTHNENWRLPKPMRDKWQVDARADLYPHLMYMPMLDMERLAAQIIFGPRDNVPKLFAAGNHLVATAPVALLSGFQDLVFRSLLKLFYESSLTARNHSSIKVAIGELLKFIAESCPIPVMHVKESSNGFSFAALDSFCPLGDTFAARGNQGIKQAFHLIETVSQTESLRRFGSTMMTVVHTHKRPLQHMQSYVDTISKLPGLPEELIKETTDMKRDLDHDLVFVKLDIEAHKAVFGQHGTIRGSVEQKEPSSASVRDILEIFEKVKYDALVLKAGVENPLASDLNLRDPIHGQKVVFRGDSNAVYSAAAGPITLVIAELIDNAAKYLRRAGELAGTASVDVSFLASRIVVANEIVLKDKRRVQIRLDEAKEAFSGSLNRAMQWADLAGFEVTPDFASEIRVEFTITFYEH